MQEAQLRGGQSKADGRTFAEYGRAAAVMLVYHIYTEHPLCKNPT
jgi:hypothetical protein